MKRKIYAYIINKSQMNYLKTMISGFIVFALIRYALPNYILGLPIDLKTLIVLSACYGLALIVRLELMERF